MRFWDRIFLAAIIGTLVNLVAIALESSLIGAYLQVPGMLLQGVIETGVTILRNDYFMLPDWVYLFLNLVCYSVIFWLVSFLWSILKGNYDSKPGIGIQGN